MVLDTILRSSEDGASFFMKSHVIINVPVFISSSIFLAAYPLTDMHVIVTRTTKQAFVAVVNTTNLVSAGGGGGCVKVWGNNGR